MLFFNEEMRARKRNVCRPGRIGEAGLQLGTPGDPVVVSLQTSFGDTPVEIKGLDGRQMTFYPESTGEVNVFNLEPGMYLYRSKLPNGRTDWDYFLKSPLNFVNTDDYNPIQKDAKGQSFLDISLLEEPVRRLEVYNQQGVRVRVLPNADRKTDRMQLSGKFNAGDYIILVVTDENAYPLKWENKEPLDNTSAAPFLAYMDQTTAHIRSLSDAGISAIEVFDIQGRQMMKRVENNLAQTSFSMQTYPAGMYIVLINGETSVKLVRP
jgi:hypothetical protein